MSGWITYSRLPWLIGASLLLLAFFEAFWLRKSWSDQQSALRDDFNHTFIRTMMDLQDTLVRRGMGGIPDTNMMRRWHPELPFPDIQTTRKFSFTRSDLETNMITTTARDTGTHGEIRIIIANSDTAAAPSRLPVQSIDRVILQMGEKQKKDGSSVFVVKLNSDTVSQPEIARHLTAALQGQGLPSHFVLRKTQAPQKPRPPNDLVTDPAPIGLLEPQFFEASLHQYHGFLFRRVLPNLLFAFFLFGITALAFGAIFRNLQEQRRLALLKNELISNISHELKTPITTVGVALEAMSDFAVLQKPEQSREYLRIAQSELERLQLLVEKVLRLSSFEQGQMPLHPETIDLKALTRQICSTLQLQARRSGRELRYELPETGAVWVSGDRVHLSGVVYNLIDNAIKYGGGTEQIDLKLALHNGWVSLSVSDQGPGIPEKYRQQVFDKFFRVPTGDQHNIKGHGLGLSYAADVVRQHGGSIDVACPPGGGCTFTIQLPQVAAEDRPEESGANGNV